MTPYAIAFSLLVFGATAMAFSSVLLLSLRPGFERGRPLLYVAIFNLGAWSVIAAAVLGAVKGGR